MPSIHVTVPTAIHAFDYGLHLVGAAVGRYATVRLELDTVGLAAPEAHSDALLRGARVVFKAGGVSPTGLSLTIDYTPPDFAQPTATLAAAGAAAANVLIGTRYTQRELFDLLVRAGLPPELSAAALFGGFQVATGQVTMAFDAPVDEIGVLRVAEAAPLPPPPPREAAGAVLAIALGLAQGRISGTPPIVSTPPVWYEALLRSAREQGVRHLSPLGAGALALDDTHLAHKLERTVEQFRSQTKQQVTFEMFSINRQGVSISEVGRFAQAPPTPYRGGDDDHTG